MNISGDWSAMSYTAIIQKPTRSIEQENENIIKQGSAININLALEHASLTGLVKGKTLWIIALNFFATI